MHNLSANLEHSEGSVLITKLFFFLSLYYIQITEAL